MVTVKTPLACIKTNKQMETQGWVFLLIFRTHESFVDPSARRSWLEMVIAGWCLRAAPPAPAPCLSQPSCFSSPWASLVLVSTPILESSSEPDRGQWSELKSNSAKYVCLSLCVHVWKRAQLPRVIHGKAVPRSVLARGQEAAREEEAGKEKKADNDAKYYIFRSHCLRPEQLN